MDKLRNLLGKEFIQSLDYNFRFFAREIRKMIRDELDCVIAITGYPGLGKSNLASILGMLIDFDYDFENNICFIPTSKVIKDTYMSLPIFSYFHIDEASKGLHKQKWYDKIQQTVNTLYDTERENHNLCTAVLMPRFQNFTENFRNFRIIYWIHITTRGIAIVYRKDEDKDTKDPWHIDENYKKKSKIWKGKRVFERSLNDIIRTEQKTPNYWFYFKIPPIPKEIWDIYKKCKRESREVEKEQENDMQLESYKDKLEREKMDRWRRIKELKLSGRSNAEISAFIGCSSETIRRHLRSMEAYESIKGSIIITPPQPTNSNNIIYNQLNEDKLNQIPKEFDKIREKERFKTSG